MTIKSKDISIIFQGPVNHKGKEVSENIEKTRLFFSDSEIILSTWEQEQELVIPGVDKIIYNCDPGSGYTEPATKTSCSAKRQVVSSISGLREATRKYAIKIRTDFYLDGNSFIENWSDNLNKKDSYLFKLPVAILALGCNDPLKTIYLNHLSDFFFFGLKEDLLKFWNIQDQINSNHISLQKKIFRPFYGALFGKLSAEQQYFNCFMINNNLEKFSINYRDQFSFDIMKNYEKVIFNNFILLDIGKSNIHGPRRIERIKNHFHHYNPNQQIDTSARNYYIRQIRAILPFIILFPKQLILSIFAINVYLISKFIYQKGR
jgi:hypothetical protein